LEGAREADRAVAETDNVSSTAANRFGFGFPNPPCGTLCLNVLPPYDSDRVGSLGEGMDCWLVMSVG